MRELLAIREEEQPPRVAIPPHLRTQVVIASLAVPYGVAISRGLIRGDSFFPLILVDVFPTSRFLFFYFSSFVFF